jgi:hypothetical protein
MKKYYPYKSIDKPDKKYFIITNTGKRVYFGQAGTDDFTITKNEERKQRYIARHKKNEDWDDINSAAFWSRFYLWEKPTKKEAYENIQQKLKKIYIN